MNERQKLIPEETAFTTNVR